jgi:hypothetical protein
MPGALAALAVACSRQSTAPSIMMPELGRSLEHVEARSS